MTSMESPKKEKEKGKEKKRKKLQDVEIQKTLISSKNLVQSSIITFASYDFTLMQSKILAQIIEELQFFIKEAITNEKNNVNRQLSIFTNKDFIDDDNPDSIRLRISLSKLSSSCRQYRNVKAAAYAMSSIPIEMPYYDKEGQLWKEVGTLCKVRFPEKKQITEIELVITKTIAEYLLDVKTKGYTEYLKEVIENSRNQYTPRLYMLLCAYVKRKDTVSIMMKELRKLLKLESKHKIYRDFNNYVLKPAYEDLMTQAENGISDFYFTYEKGYKEGRKRAGEPDYIIFNLHQRNTLDPEQEDSDVQLKRKYIYDLLRSQHIMMDEKLATEICQKITADNQLDILEKIMELSEIFRKEDRITNRASYTYVVLKKIVDEKHQE